MTPGARVQAAAEILDTILDGLAAEQALTGWARRSRYAGSKDRAAVRDHVFDALRCKRSYAALGGAETGRGLMLGAARASGTAPETLFTGQGHGAPALTVDEQAGGRAPTPGPEASDLPDWLWPLWQDSLGADGLSEAALLKDRAPVFLRVNLKKTDLAAAQIMLAQDGIETRAHPVSPTALEVTAGPRKVAQSNAYLDGCIELQDAASQAVIDAIPISNNLKVLDYCAGGERCG